MAMNEARARPEAPSLPRQGGDVARRGGDRAGTATSPAPPVRPRRRPALIAAGIVLVGFGGLGAAWLVDSSSDTRPVLALAHDVPEGQALTVSDLAVVRVTPDPALTLVPAGDRDAVVGQRSSTTLLAGSLLTPTSVTASAVPAAGQSVVGVSLTAAQMPAEPLVAGDPVRIVSTPPTQADPPTDAPDAMSGEVVAVSARDAAGATTVDVLVPDLEAAGLAARAATGRVALVLDARSA